ncbi:MAG: hypothetical protein Q9186_004354 [Xanthomendoza sp. 1 TL-2023]
MADKNETKTPFGHAMRSHFLFDPSYIPLNHGAFGTYPKPVKDRLHYYQDLTESRPDSFFRFGLTEFLDPARGAIAEFLGVDVGDLVFQKGDVIVHFSTIYGGCENTVEYLKETTPAESTEIPLCYPIGDDEVVAKFQDKIRALKSEGSRARVAIFDTVSSLPGVRVPWERLVKVCRDEGTLSLVDGAHGIGHIQLDLGRVQPDFFVSNCHKWLYVPRGCALFHVPKKNHHLIRSSIPTSHGYEPYPVDGQEKVFNPFPVHSQGRFVNLFQFVGTMDVGPYLCIEEALKFRREVCGGENAIMGYCEDVSTEGGRKVAEIWGTEIMDNAETTLTRCCLTNVRLPLEVGEEDGKVNKADAYAVVGWMAQTLIKEYNMFAPPFFHNNALWVRFSGQIYVEMDDFVAAAGIYQKLCERVVKGEPMKT